MSSCSRALARWRIVRDPAAASGARTAYLPGTPARPEDSRHVSVGTAFHPATAPLNRKQQWREWSGYFASSAYADAHDIEYNAIREAAALIDVSPLYNSLRGGHDAAALVDRVSTRGATKVPPGRVTSTPGFAEPGRV